MNSVHVEVVRNIKDVVLKILIISILTNLIPYLLKFRLFSKLILPH